jgi:molybdopterin-containing oxidoreductase family membrane subunit
MSTHDSVISSTVANRRFSVPGRVAVLALLALFAYGVWAWSYQVSNGLGVTNMRDIQIWGAYIALFMFLVGASAGGMIVASIATVFHIDKISHLSRYAVWVSLVTITIAGLTIIPDLGEPQRFWHMFTYASWTSPMIWDVIVVLGYGFMNLCYLWVHTRRDLAARHSWLAFGSRPATEGSARRDHRLIAAFAYLAIPFAFALHSITAFIIGTMPSHPYWYSTAMAPLFITSALTSGVALVLLVLLALERLGRLEVGADARRWLAGFLAVSILLNFFIIAVEVITISEGRLVGAWAAVSQLTIGSYGWIFWTEVVTGIAALAVVITPRGRSSRPLVAAAAGLVLLNVALERVQLIVGGLRYPNIGAAPGISLGTPAQLNMIGVPTRSSFVEVARYTPSWVEWSIVVGLCALWGLLLLVGIRFLPLGTGHPAALAASASPTRAAATPASAVAGRGLEGAIPVAVLTAPTPSLGGQLDVRYEQWGALAKADRLFAPSDTRSARS